MALDLVTPFVDAWLNYVIGSPTIAALMFLFFITLWGIKSNWPVDVFIVFFVPLFFILSMPVFSVLPTSLFGLIIIGLGFLIGIGLLALIRQR